jgi:hypothetical protein
VFCGVSYDNVTPTGLVGRRRRNAFRDDSWNVTPGFVWEREKVRYTCEVGVASTAGFGDESATVVTVRPAASWEVPGRFTLGSETRWIMGIGVPVTFGPAGTDVSASVKFRGDFDIKRLFGRQ